MSRRHGAPRVLNNVEKHSDTGLPVCIVVLNRYKGLLHLLDVHVVHIARAGLEFSPRFSHNTSLYMVRAGKSRNHMVYPTTTLKMQKLGHTGFPLKMPGLLLGMHACIVE